MAFRHLSHLFNKKEGNKVKIVFLNFLVTTSCKNDYFIYFNSCYFLVWTKCTCMLETFEMLIALINGNSIFIKM